MEFLTGINLAALIETVGYAGLFGIIFAESGLLFGFIFPGDSLLFTAGFLASQGFGNIITLAALGFIAAVLGDSAGYAVGKKFGPKIFRREDSWFFHRAHLERTKRFYEEHGGTTLILARFMPVIRTFAPIFAGVGNMPYSLFLCYNIAGGFLWAVGLLLLGYTLGRVIPGIDRYLIPLVILIIVVSSVPPLLHFLKERRRQRT